MFQQLILIGNLGSDPEMRYTPSGVPVANFRMAVNRRWTNQDGQAQDKTTWFKVTTWRRNAELVSQYLTKGQKVMIIGEVEEPQTWTDREGNVRVSLEVTALQVKFIGSRGDNAGGGASGDNYSNQPAAVGAQNSEDFASDEDIPF